MLKPYYQDDAITLYHADCRDVFGIMEKVDHVISDPPYSEHVHGKSRAGARGPRFNGRGELTAAASISRAVDFGFDALSPELRRDYAQACGALVRRWVLTFSDEESASLVRDDMTAAKLEHIRLGHWIKIGATPQFTGDRPATGTEAITLSRARNPELDTLLAKLEPHERAILDCAFFDAAGDHAETDAEPIIISHPEGKKRWNGGGKHALWFVPIALNRDGSSPRHHPTEKPLALLLQLIAQFTDPGDLVADFFGGSSTTAIAAKQLGRRAIVVELQEEHCATSVRRFEKQAAQGALPLASAHRSKKEIAQDQVSLFERERVVKPRDVEAEPPATSKPRKKKAAKDKGAEV